MYDNSKKNIKLFFLFYQAWLIKTFGMTGASLETSEENHNVSFRLSSPFIALSSFNFIDNDTSDEKQF